MDKKPRIFAMSFGSVYPLYVQKAERKGRTKAEVDEVITWLTGYSRAQLERVVRANTDLESFFAEAPRLNPNATLITGVVCGIRVEEIVDPLMQKIRYLDKLVDELAKGKQMASILRKPSDAAPTKSASTRAARTTAKAKRPARAAPSRSKTTSRR